MSLHDAYARVTPFELTFRGDQTPGALVEAVEEEADGRGTDPDEPAAFVTMGAVGAFVREVQGPEAPPEAIHQYAAVTFHSFHFERAGRPLYVMSAHVARYLVDGASLEPAGPPARAGYLQLPQHLFWFRGEEEDAVPESIDGLFWYATERGMLHTLVATGLRGDRPGVGVVVVPEAPLPDVGLWLDIDARGDGTDFASEMPGSELDRLYAVRTSGEILKLLGRFFAYVATAPDALQAAEPPEDPGDDDPPPSAFTHTRVVLAG